jgi:hypothetical protein
MDTIGVAPMSSLRLVEKRGGLFLAAHPTLLPRSDFLATASTGKPTPHVYVYVPRCCSRPRLTEAHGSLSHLPVCTHFGESTSMLHGHEALTVFGDGSIEQMGVFVTSEPSSSLTPTM